MKKILLASASIVAFAGAAAAEISFSGVANLSYNDTDATAVMTTAADDNDGFYWGATLTAALSQELDNGITAGATVNFDIQEDNQRTGGNTNLNADDYVLFVKSENASLYYGDTGTAAVKYWASAGDMESDGFTSDWTDAVNADAVLRADINYGSVEASVSTLIVSAADNSQEEQTSFSARTTIGGVTITAATEEKADTTITGAAAGDFNANDVWGVSASMAVAGADVTVAYAETDTGANGTNSSTGIKVAYPVGDVTVTAYYVDENPSAANLAANAHKDDANYGIAIAYAAGDVSVTLDLQDDQGVTKTSVDATYDLGNGLKVMAGMYDENGTYNSAGVATPLDDGTDSYVAASYDLGGGAALFVSYANADTAGAIKADEVGTPDYQDGTTLSLTFAF